MTDDHRPMDWSQTTFAGSRRKQLRQAQRLTLRQRLEALDELTELSERLRAMPRQIAAPAAPTGVHEPRFLYLTDASRHDIVLDGCTPTPLANYLKALVCCGCCRSAIRRREASGVATASCCAPRWIVQPSGSSS